MENIGFAEVFVFVTFISLLSPSNAQTLGFSMELIHRDSPPSPFHNPSLTSFEHLSNSLRRSHERANHFKSVSSKSLSYSSALVASGGSYLMKITLGTPPSPIFAIADTGSDITWTQCAPCTDCYKQKAPLFNPKKSSTYKEFPCKSAKCLSFDYHLCSANGTCIYSIRYGDNSVSEGPLASETLTLGSNRRRPVRLPNITFGCGFHNNGTFDENGSGIVGLGGGKLSLISQLNSSISGKFSHCMVPWSPDTNAEAPGQIYFGKKANVSGSGVVSTPIISKFPETFYYLTLEALSVDEHRVELFNSSTSKADRKGNIIIDSGTTLTHLPPDAYNRFESLVKKVIGVETIADPTSSLDLCYTVNDKLSIPTIKAHFTGATIDLKPINTFIKTRENVTCLAFAKSDRDFAIFGNIQQANFMVGYDLAKKIVSFKHFKC